MADSIRLKVEHKNQPVSNPYESDVEEALDALKAAGLVERGGGKGDTPGIIRHETGPEIILLVGALIELGVTLSHLFQASRRHHPETTINIVMADEADLRRTLTAIGSQASASTTE